MHSINETSILDLALSKAIVDQAPDAIIFADPTGIIRVWNNGAERIFGHKASDVIGGSLDVIIPERLVQGHNNGFNHAMTTNQMKYVNKVLVTRSMHKDGSKLYVELSFGMVHDPEGNILGALAIARDITERYASEAALRVRMTELENAVKSKS
jgi:PAS domain S-box-containing protein